MAFFHTLFCILTKFIQIFVKSPVKKYIRVRVYDIARGDCDYNEAPYDMIMLIDAMNPVIRYMPKSPKVLKANVSCQNEKYNSIVKKITGSLIPMEEISVNEAIMFVGPIYEIDMCAFFECCPPDYDEENIASVDEIVAMAK
jgi:hypothetical protein